MQHYGAPHSLCTYLYPMLGAQCLPPTALPPLCPSSCFCTGTSFHRCDSSQPHASVAVSFGPLDSVRPMLSFWKVEDGAALRLHTGYNQTPCVNYAEWLHTLAASVHCLFTSHQYMPSSLFISTLPFHFSLHAMYAMP